MRLKTSLNQLTCNGVLNSCESICIICVLASLAAEALSAINCDSSAFRWDVISRSVIMYCGGLLLVLIAAVVAGLFSLSVVVEESALGDMGGESFRRSWLKIWTALESAVDGGGLTASSSTLSRNFLSRNLCLRADLETDRLTETGASDITSMLTMT